LSRHPGAGSFINVPLALFVLGIVFCACRRAEEALIDWTGGCTASNYRLGTMVYGLIESSNLGLGHPVVLSTLAVVVTLIAFIFVEALTVGHQ